MTKYFIVDYKFGNEPVETKKFRWDDEQPLAEEFCRIIKKAGGLINICIREEWGEFIMTNDVKWIPFSEAKTLFAIPVIATIAVIIPRSFGVNTWKTSLNINVMMSM